MDHVIVFRQNFMPRDVGRHCRLSLGHLALNMEEYTIDQFIAALPATPTLPTLFIMFNVYEPTPENNRRVVDPICRCIANLRRHNQNHMLRTLKISEARNDPNVEQFLVAAKQCGIRHLDLSHSDVSIQSLVEFCRDNGDLKVLEIQDTTLFDQESTISVAPQDGSQDSTALLALDKLIVVELKFANLSSANKFSNFIAQVCYPVLEIGDVSFDSMHSNPRSEWKEKENLRIRIVSALIKPSSVQQITLFFCCHRSVMDAIEACVTVTQIRVEESSRLIHFDTASASTQQKLRAIVARNRELARFVANPLAYPDSDMLALIGQFDSNPTGRYMLARCFSGIPTLFKI